MGVRYRMVVPCELSTTEARSQKEHGYGYGPEMIIETPSPLSPMDVYKEFHTVVDQIAKQGNGDSLTVQSLAGIMANRNRSWDITITRPGITLRATMLDGGKYFIGYAE